MNIEKKGYIGITGLIPPVTQKIMSTITREQKIDLWEELEKINHRLNETEKISDNNAFLWGLLIGMLGWVALAFIWELIELIFGIE